MRPYIKGKYHDAPIWNLLGGKVRNKVRLHLLLGIEHGNSKSNNQGVLESAKKAVDIGFTALKIDPLPHNYFDLSLDAWLPVEEVKGDNQGISHTFSITEDEFATGNKTLVNHKTYYFMALAYSFNGAEINTNPYNPLNEFELFFLHYHNLHRKYRATRPDV